MDAFTDGLSRAAQAAFDAQFASFASICDWQRDAAWASMAAMTAVSNEFLPPTPARLTAICRRPWHACHGSGASF